MGGETGVREQEYAAGAGAEESGLNPIGMLERVLARCSPGTVVHESNGDGHYVAFRRMGCAYAVRLESLPGFVEVNPSNLRSLGRDEAKMVVSAARKEMDELVDEINYGLNDHAIARGTNTRNTCLGHADYDPRHSLGEEYILPEGTMFIRRAKRRIMFYSGIPPEAQRKEGKPMPARRRDYFEVPESAGKVRCSGSEYEWLVNGEWAKKTKKAE